jgi:hypothetical protein
MKKESQNFISIVHVKLQQLKDPASIGKALGPRIHFSPGICRQAPVCEFPSVFREFPSIFIPLRNAGRENIDFNIKFSLYWEPRHCIV